jgi:hypothetical protein
MQSTPITWTDVVKKEAKGLNDFSLGEVQEVGTNYIFTQRGTIRKSKFYIPQYLVRGFDGHTLWFNVSESQAEIEFKREMPPAPDEYYRYRTAGTPTDAETSVPSVP